MPSKTWDLEDGFDRCSKGFSGKLQIRSTQNFEWNFHFFMGRIVGESGGIHPIRYWQQLLLSHCQQMERLPILSEDGWDLSGFQTNPSGCLERLVKRSQISREQALEVAKISLLDSLFDVLQHETISRQSSHVKLSYEAIPESSGVKGLLPWIFFRPQETLQEALEMWFRWQQEDLVACSPSWAPVIYGIPPLSVHPLAKDVLPLIDGQRTIRDLGICLRQPAINIMRFLIEYVRNGLIGLKPVSDIPASNTLTLKNQTLLKFAETKLSVAYVDDSLLEGQLMGNILQSVDCEYLHIHDPLKAIPMLLKQKTDLIFLDLVMPIVNGYEVCAQLRRVSIFAQTPIVILTSSDGLIDRMRAKVVGSTEFMAKPISRKKVIAVLEKYALIPRAEMRFSDHPDSENATA